MKQIDHPAIKEHGTLDQRGLPTGWFIDTTKLQSGEYGIKLAEDGTLHICGVLIEEMAEERRAAIRVAGGVQKVGLKMGGW